MMYDKASFLAGLACGLCGRGVGVKTPIAYLYNGVELPPLPEYDQTAYPYAVIGYAEVDSIKSGGRIASLTISSEPIYFKRTGIAYTKKYSLLGNVRTYVLANDTEVWDWYFSDIDPNNPVNTWVVCGESAYAERTDTPSKLVIAANMTQWANHDILYMGDKSYADGTVCLSASVPVPVYE